MQESKNDISLFRLQFPKVVASDDAISALFRDIRICNVVGIKNWPRLTAREKSEHKSAISVEKAITDIEQLMKANFDTMIFDVASDHIRRFRETNPAVEVEEDFLRRLDLLDGLLVGNYVLSMKGHSEWVFRITERFIRVQLVSNEPPTDPDEFDFTSLELELWTPSYKSDGRGLEIVRLA